MNLFRLKNLVCLLLVINGAMAFDLSDAYQSALSYNADFLANVAKNKAGQENAVQGRSQLLPQINANGNLSENYLNSDTAYVYYNQPSLSVQLQQVIYDFSKFSQYTKNKFQTNVSDLQLEKAKQKLILDVAQAYFDVLYAHDTITTITATKNSFNQQFIQASKSFNAGVVNITDVNDAKSSFDTASADEIKAKNDLINKENIFRNLTGLNPDQIQAIIPEIKLVNPNPNNINAWVDISKNNNMNIKIANLQMKMAEQDVNIAFAGHLPNAYLSGGYQNQGATNINNSNAAAQQFLIPSMQIPGVLGSTYSAASAAVMVNLPIYSGGLVSSQVKQAKSNYSAAQNQLISVERETEQNIKNQFFSEQNGVNIVKARAEAMKSSELKLKSDQIGYKTGSRSSIDLVGAEKNYYKSVQDYNQARYQYLLDSLNLTYTAGTIDSKALSQINSNINTVASK